MKIASRFAFFAAISLFSATTLAGTLESLEGRTYSRQTGRPLGAPASHRGGTVSLSFEGDWKVVDSTNRVGGYGPQHCTYSMLQTRSRTKVTVVCGEDVTQYLLGDGQRSLTQLPDGPAYWLDGVSMGSVMK